ncbi:MAG: lamin tail domain-containing protein [Planctomycetes bacterium]|nr:lamin tail domain-containing protein [Planctomycetota bacterium]
MLLAADVAISEIMYHPVSGLAGDDWLEIHNAGDAPADLAGTAWTDPAYDDAGWPTGRGLLYVEGSTLPAPKNTPLTIGRMTYYFRTHFTLTGDPAQVASLDLSTIVDDGAVVYLNGVEVYRYNMPDGPIDYLTTSESTVNNAGVLGPLAIPAGALEAGDNVLAVEVHQRDSGSSDVVMGLALDAVVEIPPQDGDLARLMALVDDVRITELMYHPAGDAGIEFIELMNTGPLDLDLTGLRLAGGIDFTFPAVTLAPAGWADGDFTADGAVDLDDFVVIKQNFGRAAAAPAVGGTADLLAADTVATRVRPRRRHRTPDGDLPVLDVLALGL